MSLMTARQIDSRIMRVFPAAEMQSARLILGRAETPMWAAVLEPAPSAFCKQLVS